MECQGRNRGRGENREEILIEVSIWPGGRRHLHDNVTRHPTEEDTMTNLTDPVALLEQAYDHAEGVLAEIGPDHHELPTPCTEWNVHDLVNHMIGSVHFMASVVAGDEPSAGDAPDFAASQEPAKEFRMAADRSLAVWRSDGALDGMVNLGPIELPAQAVLGLNQLEMIAHAWDLCVALGVDRSIDSALAESAFAVAQMVASDELRGDRFGPAVPIADDAPAHDRLAAFLGRQPV
jgi:uncharacterized protein (TIGR03086 family)